MNERDKKQESETFVEMLTDADILRSEKLVTDNSQLLYVQFK